MNRRLLRAAGATALALALVLMTARGDAQVRPGTKPPARPPSSTTTFTPRFEAVAETRLLMEGLAHSNYQSVHRLLQKPPADVETWKFARGQALLIAETGNLLLLRPPRNEGRDTWMRLGMDVRDKATAVARAAAARNHAQCKTALTALTASCNRCHQTFRVPVKVAPGPEPGELDAE
jgi:hypothetical protein